jgi:hypothetical protein
MPLFYNKTILYLTYNLTRKGQAEMNSKTEIEEALQKVVDSRELAGAATLVWRASWKYGEAQTACVDGGT